jgi:dihydrofolate reductase
VARLIYSAIASLDGYVEDADGNFDWARPDDDLHAFVNDLERPIGTYLYGRRMYETMVFWETAGSGPEQPAVTRDFAEIWRAAEKVVYSRTLDRVSSARTWIEQAFQPSAVRRMKETARSDLTIGGAELAGEAIRAGLVDECHLFVVPVLVGAGKRFLPDGVRAQVQLIDQRRFGSGAVYLRYGFCRAK